jgi:putative salt-induced outer membrane protein
MTNNRDNDTMKIQYLFATALLFTATPALAQEEQVGLWGWNGSIEAGADYANGNTDKSSFRSGISLKQELEKWENDIELKARIAKENGARTEETYRIKGETDYKYTELTYAFLEGEYVNDQFSGYEYRITEAVGLGHKLIDAPDLRLDIKGSVGGRHTKEDTAAGTKENEVIFKPAAELDWAITETLSFNQKIASVIGTDKTITSANSALSTHLIGNLKLKLALDVEHTSKVPAGTKKTDTLTSLNLVYDF